MQKTITEQERTINKILRWFPLVGEYLRVESECLMHGFSEEQTDKLVHGQEMTMNKLQLTVEQLPIHPMDSATVET